MPGKNRASNSAFGWWSARPLLLGLLAAAIFIATRTLYTAVFGGVTSAPHEQTVLWDLPQLRLPGPFASIHLFGVMTLEMLFGAVVSALGFAMLIVVFATLGSVVDFRILLRSTPRWLAGISTSLVIALGMFTTFAMMAKRVNTARLLRGEPSRLRTLVPLLEHSIERAEWMGLSMASRGWGGANSHPKRVTAASVSLRDVSVSVDGRMLLHDVNFTLEPGTITVLTGATGSGKTTLLQALRGFYDGSSIGGVTVGGEITLLGAQPSLALPIGLTSQHPELTFVAPTVHDELVFGAIQNGLDTDIAATRAAQQAGIVHLLDRRIDQLSAGEQAVVAIAAACTAQPRILLLDEPIADLDAAAAEYVVCVLRELRDAGVTVLVAEHRAEALAAVADRWLRIDAASVQEAEPATATGSVLASPKTDPALSKEILILEGPNGAGKTTLLTSLALHNRRAVPSVAMVPHRVDDLFFSDTVSAECARSDARKTQQSLTAREQILRFLPDFESFDLNPRDCSAGTRVVIAICLQLALDRKRLILDEPTRGLDVGARRELVGVLRELASSDVQLIVATHDREFAAALGGIKMSMRDGHLLDAQIADGWLQPQPLGAGK